MSTTSKRFKKLEYMSIFNLVIYGRELPQTQWMVMDSKATTPTTTNTTPGCFH